MDNRIIVFGNLSAFATELKAKYAKQSALEALQNKVQALEVVGGQANVLEGVKINGTALSIAEKMVDILVATGSENGTISVNGANVAVAGLQALAFKAQVSEADLDEALAAVIAAKASNADLTALTGRVSTAEGAIATLNGEGEGSVKKQVADAVASIVDNAPEAYNTLKELSDWLASHETDAAGMNSSISQNKADIKALSDLVGKLPEGVTSTTVVDYIAEAIAALGIGDYAKTSEVTAAINTALENYYNKTQIDAKVTELNGAISAVDAKFANYSTTEQMNAAIKVVDDKFANYYNETEIDDKVTALNGAISAVDGKFANYSTTEQMNAAIKATDDKLANYVLTSSVGTVTESEVKALLA